MSVEGNARYLEILEDMRALHIGKAAGYSGDGPDTWRNFREAENWGVSPLQGCLVRLGDKYKRAQNIFKNSELDFVGEPLPQTLIDLASYALIAICLYEEERGS